MDMPPIYQCVSLNHEHEQLKRKIAKLKARIAQLEQIIAEKNLDHTRSCSIACQADIVVAKRPIRAQPIKSSSSSDEEAHLHQLVKAQNELLKRYEEEAIDQRRHQQDHAIPSPELIEEYEHRLHRCEKEKRHAEQRAVVAQQHMTKLEKRCNTIREKLSLLDHGFFEEVKDLKFAYQQAVGLNREYEKTIQMLSAQLGIAYPIADQ